MQILFKTINMCLCICFWFKCYKFKVFLNHNLFGKKSILKPMLMSNLCFYFQILGRMLEVLDEVYVPSIPLFYFSGSVLQLYPHVYHALLKNTFSLVYFK